MALLRFLIPLFFLLFSFTEIGRIQLQNAVAINLTDIIILPIFFIWLFKIKKSKNYFLSGPLVLFTISCFISLIFSFSLFPVNNILIGSLYLFRFIYYSFLYFVFRDFDEKLHSKVLNYLFLSGIIIIIIGFIQYFLYPNLANLMYQGWDNHIFRLFSTFLDPNFAGTFLVLFFIFIFILRDQIKFLKNKYILYFLLIANFVAIILTYSRGAILMLGVSCLAYCFVKKNFKLIVFFVGILIITGIILSPRYYIENTNLFRMASTTARLESIQSAFKIYERNKLFGVGFNNFRYAREKYGYQDLSKFGPSHSGAGTDNSFVLVLVNSGILGILTFIFLQIKLLKLSLMKISSNKLSQVLFVSLIGLIANSMFINSLFYSFFLIWIFILAGVTERSLHE